jgi:hypothetical protein
MNLCFRDPSSALSIEILICKSAWKRKGLKNILHYCLYKAIHSPSPSLFITIVGAISSATVERWAAILKNVSFKAIQIHNF